MINMKKILLVAALMFVMVSSSLAYCYQPENKFSVRGNSDNYKLNVWSNGDKGQGEIIYKAYWLSNGDNQFRYKLKQVDNWNGYKGYTIEDNYGNNFYCHGRYINNYFCVCEMCWEAVNYR